MQQHLLDVLVTDPRCYRQGVGKSNPLTGVTSRAEVERFPYRPSRIIESVADLVDELG
ncbi:MAG: 5-nucleotidase [Solirubrobacterales bacterium]|nr:5-nucleotidase [Solirubrobacterales bacterium]